MFRNLLVRDILGGIYLACIPVSATAGSIMGCKLSLDKHDSIPTKILAGTAGAACGAFLGGAFGAISPFLLVSVPFILHDKYIK